MNANFGILPQLEGKKIKDKKEREKIVNMIPGYMLELMEDFVYARRRKKEK